MGLDLRALRFNLSELNDFSVKKVKVKTEISTWGELVSASFQIKVDLDFLSDLSSDKNAHFYVGTYQGKPVSSLLMFESSGVVGLHAVTTLKDFRHKSFAKLISGTALAHAKHLGYNMAVLHASDLGMMVYKKLGFKKYGDILSYELPKYT